MQSGNYNCRGVVKSPPETLGGRGQRTGEWVKVCVWWCSIEITGGGETETAKRQHATASYLLEGHYSRKITTQHRIYVRGKVLEISHVENVGMMNRTLRITASEVK